MFRFDEVIDFAIKREQEAVQFYRDLQLMARFSPQKEVLKDFELMEEGHVRLLEGVKERHSAERLAVRIPEDLQLSSYLADTAPTAEMTYQDILIAAMKKEERSVDLYSLLRDRAGDTETRKLFDRLVAEEENHRHHFEAMYDRDIQGDN